MKVVPNIVQGSLEWLAARAGIPTASEFDNLVTPEFRTRTGEMVKSYLALKLAESWTGGPMPGHNSIDMEIGQILEKEAIPYFEMQTEFDVQRVGLITTDDGRIGCSPDGLIGDVSGLECKCPLPQTHVKYLTAGVVPKDYLPQVQGAMFVTGRSHWWFMSYCRRFPALIIRVDRCEMAQAALRDALDEFLARFDDGMKRLVELNGGPPFRANARIGRVTITGIPDNDPFSYDIIP